MTRPIKFRAWDKAQRRWLMWDDGTFRLGEEHFAFERIYEDSNFVIVQFIGLHDKNGKEICAGDVVEHERYDRPYSKARKTWKVRGVVEWYSGFDHSEKAVKSNPILKENPSMFNQNPRFWLRLLDGQKEGGYDWSEFHNCEVIGNIYENPELLTK